MLLILMLFSGIIAYVLQNLIFRLVYQKGLKAKINFYTNYVDYEEEGNLISSAELKDALSTLTPPDAQIILLSIIGGFTSYELGVIYNMTPGAVRTRQKRAIEKLRKILM